MAALTRMQDDKIGAMHYVPREVFRSIVEKRWSTKAATRARLDIVNDSMYAVLRYHDTDVVSVDYPDGMVALSTGGYSTATTKARMNEVLPMGWRVYQHDFYWYLAGPPRPARDPDTTAPVRFDRWVTFRPHLGGFEVASDVEGGAWRDW